MGMYVGLLMFTLFIPNSLTRVSIYYFLHTIITLLAVCLQGPKHNWHVIFMEGVFGIRLIKDFACRRFKMPFQI